MSSSQGPKDGELQVKGAQIISLMRSLGLPHLILGVGVAERLEEIDPELWYPRSMLTGLMARVEQRMGPQALRKMGRIYFALVLEPELRRVAKSARDVLDYFDALYRTVNRGETTGGWRVVEFRPGFALVEKTTASNCIRSEGILDAALKMVGAPSKIAQPSCVRRGDELCRFALTSEVTDDRWSGGEAGPW